MPIDIVPTHMTVADYCRAMETNDIRVNRDYQRSDQVWPPAARSFLIETILLGFPVPKFSLHQITDLRSRRTIKEIIDGQQRSGAIFDFFSNDLRLSAMLDLEEARGCVYDQLSEDLQTQFMEYRLSIDLFVSATVADVREVFRRINSYTIPLNPEEQRHATFQGLFKWFINRLARDLGDAFAAMGAFGEKQLVRMADAKLLTEICHAFLFGISTTNKTKLDALYESKDELFPEQADLDGRIRDAIGILAGLNAIHRTELMKPHQLYSLLLAISHFLRPADRLRNDIPPVKHGSLDPATATSGLSSLAAAVERGSPRGRYGRFVRASATRTNVKDQRITRVKWMYHALMGDVPR